MPASAAMLARGWKLLASSQPGRQQHLNQFGTSLFLMPCQLAQQFSIRILFARAHTHTHTHTQAASYRFPHTSAEKKAPEGCRMSRSR